MASAAGVASAVPGSPVCLLVLGMAGSGKTALVQVTGEEGREGSPPRRLARLLTPVLFSRRGWRPTCTASAAPPTSSTSTPPCASCPSRRTSVSRGWGGVGAPSCPGGEGKRRGQPRSRSGVATAQAPLGGGAVLMGDWY